ncbi:ycgS, partial [Symbiodinium sp. KB8]
ESAEPVLLFYPLGACRFLAAVFATPARRAGARLICLNRPGMGKASAARTGNVSDHIAAHCQDAVKCLDHLGYERARVLFLCAGAPFALAFQARYPTRTFGRLVGCSAWVSPLDCPRAKLMYRLSASLPSTMLATLADAVAGWTRAVPSSTAFSSLPTSSMPSSTSSMAQSLQGPQEHHNRAMDPFSAAAKMVKMAGHLIQTIITADEANRTTVVLRSLGAELFGHSLAFDATLTNLDGQILDNSCHLEDCENITISLHDDFGDCRRFLKAMAGEAFNPDSGGFAVKWTLKASAEEPKVRAGEVARVAGLQTDENEPLQGMTIEFMRIFGYLALLANSTSKYASTSVLERDCASTGCEDSDGACACGFRVVEVEGKLHLALLRKGAALLQWHLEEVNQRTGGLEGVDAGMSFLGAYSGTPEAVEAAPAPGTGSKSAKSQLEKLWGSPMRGISFFYALHGLY